MKEILLVAVGGGFGAVMRWLLAGVIKPPANGFPLSIFVVNVSGCFLFGLLHGFCQSRGEEWRLALLTGVLGGYTTFSTFGWENYQLVRSGQVWMALINALVSVIAGVLAVWAGVALSGKGGAP
jgi:CrcB protein